MAKKSIRFGRVLLFWIKNNIHFLIRAYVNQYRENRLYDIIFKSSSVLGNNYLEAEDLDESIRYYEKSVKSAEKLNNSEIAESKLNLSTVNLY